MIHCGFRSLVETYRSPLEWARRRKVWPRACVFQCASTLVGVPVAWQRTALRQRKDAAQNVAWLNPALQSPLPRLSLVILVSHLFLAPRFVKRANSFALALRVYKGAVSTGAADARITMKPAETRLHIVVTILLLCEDRASRRRRFSFCHDVGPAPAAHWLASPKFLKHAFHTCYSHRILRRQYLPSDCHRYTAQSVNQAGPVIYATRILYRIHLQRVDRRCEIVSGESVPMTYFIDDERILHLEEGRKSAVLKIDASLYIYIYIYIFKHLCATQVLRLFFFFCAPAADTE